MIKKYSTILALAIFLFSCSDDYELKNDIEDKQLEFREKIILSGVERPVDKIDVTDVGNGVRYAKMQLTSGDVPLIVHAALIDYNSTKAIDVLTASTTTVKGLKSPSQMIKDNQDASKQSLATINGDFFVFENQLPLGAIIQDGKIVKTSNAGTWNTVFGMGVDNKPYLNELKYTMSVTLADDRVVPITAINTNRGGEQLILFDSKYGESTGTNQWGNEFLLEPDGGIAWQDLASLEDVVCVVKGRYAGAGNKPLNRETIILSAHGQPASTLWGGTKVGDKVRIKINPVFEHDREIQSNPVNAVGAQKIIIRKSLNTKMGDDALETGRNQRSGIGYSNDKTKMALIVVEKTANSKGVSLSDFADIFAYFHISNAVNLDGGGSSSLIINGFNDGKPVNVLTDGSERRVANAISVVEKLSAK